MIGQLQPFDGNDGMMSRKAQPHAQMWDKGYAHDTDNKLTFTEISGSRKANLDETVPEVDAVSEVVGAGKMTIERSRIKLSEDKHFVYTTVDAVTHWHIDEPVSSSDRHLFDSNRPHFSWLRRQCSGKHFNARKQAVDKRKQKSWEGILNALHLPLVSLVFSWVGTIEFPLLLQEWGRPQFWDQRGATHRRAAADTWHTSTRQNLARRLRLAVAILDNNWGSLMWRNLEQLLVKTKKIRSGFDNEISAAYLPRRWLSHHKHDFPDYTKIPTLNSGRWSVQECCDC